MKKYGDPQINVEFPETWHEVGGGDYSCQSRLHTPRSSKPTITEKSYILDDGFVVLVYAILVSDGLVLHDAEQFLKRRHAEQNCEKRRMISSLRHV